jgi:hypothetical protein
LILISAGTFTLSTAGDITSLAQFVESQAEPGQVNFVFSPLSLKLALGMLREGLAGESLAELSGWRLI